MLGRADDLHLAGLARNGQRDVGLEIEMILPAAAQFARYAMRRCGKRRLDLATYQRRRRIGELRLFQPFLDAQHRRQLFPCHHDLRGRDIRLVAGLGGDDGNRVADMLGDAGGEDRLAMENRTDIVLAGNVIRRQHCVDAGHRQRLCLVDGDDACMCMRTEHERDLQRTG
jgi:hypothetical protein